MSPETLTGRAIGGAQPPGANLDTQNRAEEGVEVKRRHKGEKRRNAEARPGLEFDPRESDQLPHEGVNCFYLIQTDGTGVVVHSKNCPAADPAAAKGQPKAVWQGTLEPIDNETIDESLADA